MLAMKKTISLSALLLMLSTSLWAQEFAYVTDSLQLRVYASPSADSDVLQTIESGDSVEVLASKGGYSQVTTYDDTRGWVKSAFLVEDPPAKLLYYSVSEKNKELEAEVEALKDGIQSADGIESSETNLIQIEELQTQLAQQQQSYQALQSQLKETIAKDQLRESTTSISDIKPLVTASINKKWFFIASAVLLLLGILLGMKLSSMRMKKRLHGFSL